MPVVHVDLAESISIGLVDDEIIAFGGVELGFIMRGKPPQVLHVEQGSQMANLGVCTDDNLITIDDRDTCSVTKDDLEGLLKSAKRLSFEREAQDRAGSASGEENIDFGGDDEEEEASSRKRSAMLDDSGDEAQPPAKRQAVSGNSETGEAASGAAAAASAGSGDAAAAAAGASGSAASTGASNQKLASGMEVRLVGFQSTEMNLKTGRLGKFSERIGCWQVFIDGSSKAKAVSPEHLLAISGVEEEAASPDESANSMAATLAAIRGVIVAPPQTHSNAPGPPAGPGWHEDVIPPDDDKESFVELLRDLYFRQLRADAEHPEPPPFNRANYFGAQQQPGQPLAEGKFPNHALGHQSQMLHRLRTGDYLAMG
eukprot:CAMPEP_0206478276 /NCGR_PEP_ID=MMETSP0324_2-20121206/35929_1 /ASSEMBLY_ACC=CAM_ASM_000836 /TAXON_ID=2866 /ORGANISM="Crypthecodinium cohnii, Strain Seligo" /LENGTH=370 /DNA_ID=CAMNT_0053954495 /DNA_START=60 /DNA_END=1168 /DNA_ORIENTATION=+